MIRPLLTALLLGLFAAGCKQSPPKPADSLDSIARDYVLLSLTIGEKEAGYIDAYYGPPELQERAKADARTATLPALAERTKALRDRAAAFEGTEGLDGRRARFLASQLTAAATRLKMMQGQ